MLFLVLQRVHHRRRGVSEIIIAHPRVCDLIYNLLPSRPKGIRLSPLFRKIPAQRLPAHSGTLLAQTPSVIQNPSPILDTPGNTKLITGLGGERPDSTLLIPLIMMERVVTVLYVEGEKGLLGKKLFELQKLAGKVALAFEILILKNKILLA